MARGSAMNAGDPPLTVKVFSPAQTFYEGPARSVSAMNKEGPFDILAGHINFFSLLGEGTVMVDTGEDSVEIPISHGIVHVRQDVISLFVFGLAVVEDDAAVTS